MQSWLRRALRVIAANGIVCAIIAIEFHSHLQLRNTTVTYSLLLAILFSAIRWDRLETITAINKFAFDTCGDTVNYSSRMESSGQANRINLSERTYSRVNGCAEVPPPGFASRHNVYFQKDPPAFPPFLVPAAGVQPASMDSIIA